MSSTSQESIKRSEPIAINQCNSRRRSASVTSSNSSGSPTSPVEPQTPLGNTTPPRMFPANLSPSKSPILSFFMAQSPTKSSTFPFTGRRFGGAPVFEGPSLTNNDPPTHINPSTKDEEDEIPVAAHARRASTAGRFSQQQLNPPAPEAQQDRGAAVLRRLSLGGAFVRSSNPTNEGMPSPPPNTAVEPQSKMPNVSPRGTRAKRSATLNVDGGGKPRRAPSPMGERILKGHFDGFN